MSGMTGMTGRAAAAEPDANAGVGVDLGGRSYDILIGAGLIARTGAELSARLKTRRAVIVTDATVADLYLSATQDSLAGAGIETHSVVVRPGEASKDFATLERLTEDILKHGLERRDLLVALGGGVVGDLAGFAAAVLLRGVDFVQIPTTLLAQVDSSVGGKTAINSAAGKNLIGAFHQPRLVLADTDSLSTLPRRELLAGYAEVVKYGLLGDADFFTWLEANGPALLDGDHALLAHAIRTCCDAKARIVAADEREAGQRALLNLGHTFGHALEAEAGYGDALLHGEAVAVGMVMAFDLSARLGLCPAGDATRVRRHLSAVGLPTSLDETPLRGAAPARLIDHMWRDKKVSSGKMTFILARGIGQAMITQQAPLEDVEAVFQPASAA